MYNRLAEGLLQHVKWFFSILPSPTPDMSFLDQEIVINVDDDQSRSSLRRHSVRMSLS